MKKNLIFLSLLLFFSLTTIAQQRTSGITAPKLSKTASERGVQYNGSEVFSGPIRNSIHQQYLLEGAATKNQDAEEWIGVTYYDLQTNGTVANRLIAEPDCALTAVWTGHGQTEDTAFPNRGTFFQSAENCGPYNMGSDTRIEPDSRTGWPNIVKLDDGTNVLTLFLSEPMKD